MTTPVSPPVWHRKSAIYFKELLGSGIAVYEVGDGKQVANIQRSTSEAYEVCRML